MRLCLLGLLCLAFYCSAKSSGSGEGSGSGSEADMDDDVIEKRSHIAHHHKRSKKEGEITFPEILNKSMKAIIGVDADVKKIKQILQDYYFTDKEAQSVWPKAIRETEDTLNLPFTERELFEMEGDIKAIYRRMLECDLLLTAEGEKDKSKQRKEQAKCYSTLGEFIDVGFTDFGFPRGSIEGQAKLLEMGLAYNVMSLLVLQLTRQMSMQANVSPKLTMKADKSIIDIAENVFNFKDVTNNTLDARIQAISQPEICQIRQVLWVDFEETCESRQKRDVDTAAGIGGTSDKFLQRYRAKVIDNVTGKEVCSQVMETSEKSSKREVKQALTKVCQKEREKYVEKVSKEAKSFYGERTTSTVASVKKMWEANKKKAAKVAKGASKKQ